MPAQGVPHAPACVFGLTAVTIFLPFAGLSEPLRAARDDRSTPQTRPAPAEPVNTASRPTTQPGGRVEFQPGVWIDWQKLTVIADGRVVLRHGPLEFLACFAGKEHESIIRLQAPAAHIYMALGLIGLAPGHPSQWDEAAGRYVPADGDLVDLTVEWVQDGVERSAPAMSWVRQREYARTPIDRPWVFAGSIRLRDGGLAADRTGSGVALVDIPDSLLSLTFDYSSRNAELWCEVNSPEIPPVGTPVQLVFRAAQPRAWRVELDFRGDIRIDGRVATAPELADLIRIGRKLAPDRVQIIMNRAALLSDVERLRRALRAEGLPADCWRIE
jgi:hypothetical protein